MSISCLVCLENFETSADVVSINRCGHVFHLSCLNDWRASKQGLSNTCPLCRIPYNKRSLTKLFLGVAESEQDFKKDLQKLEEEKTREELEKKKYLNELNDVKTALGIKCQAYHIIDSVNNEYLQSNQKLKEQNELLQAEMENLKRKLLQPPPPPALVDLTKEEISDDDEIEFISATRVEKVIEGVVEIDDEDDDEVQIITDCANEQNFPQDSSGVSGASDGHRMQPIEVVEVDDQAIADEIREIPIKAETDPAMHEFNEHDQAPFVKEEPPQSIEVIPDISSSMFGNVVLPADSQAMLPDLENDEPMLKKLRLNNETDFSFLRDFILSQI